MPSLLPTIEYDAAQVALPSSAVPARLRGRLAPVEESVQLRHDDVGTQLWAVISMLDGLVLLTAMGESESPSTYVSLKSTGPVASIGDTDRLAGMSPFLLAVIRYVFGVVSLSV